MLGEIEETGAEPEGSDQELIDQLNALASGEVAAAACAAFRDPRP